MRSLKVKLAAVEEFTLRKKIAKENAQAGSRAFNEPDWMTRSDGQNLTSNLTEANTQWRRFFGLKAELYRNQQAMQARIAALQVAPSTVVAPPSQEIKTTSGTVESSRRQTLDKPMEKPSSFKDRFLSSAAMIFIANLVYMLARKCGSGVGGAGVIVLGLIAGFTLHRQALRPQTVDNAGEKLKQVATQSNVSEGAVDGTYHRKRLLDSRAGQGAGTRSHQEAVVSSRAVGRQAAGVAAS